MADSDWQSLDIWRSTDEWWRETDGGQRHHGLEDCPAASEVGMCACNPRPPPPPRPAMENQKRWANTAAIVDLHEWRQCDGCRELPGEQYLLRASTPPHPHLSTALRVRASCPFLPVSSASTSNVHRRFEYQMDVLVGVCSEMYTFTNT